MYTQEQQQHKRSNTRRRRRRKKITPDSTPKPTTHNWKKWNKKKKKTKKTKSSARQAYRTLRSKKSQFGRRRRWRKNIPFHYAVRFHTIISCHMSAITVRMLSVLSHLTLCWPHQVSISSGPPTKYEHRKKNSNDVCARCFSFSPPFNRTFRFILHSDRHLNSFVALCVSVLFFFGKKTF